MIQELFDSIGIIVTNFASTLKDVFTAGLSLIYDSAETTLTPVGILLLLGLGTGLLIWGFKFIRRLIRIKTK